MSIAVPISPSRRAGDLIFTAGQLGVREDGSMADGVVEQTRLALEHVESVLEPHGVTRGDVVKTTVYLSDLDDWAAMNEPYRTFFGDRFPCRSAIQVGLPAGVLVEIEAIAVLSDSSS